MKGQRIPNQRRPAAVAPIRRKIYGLIVKTVNIDYDRKPLL